MTVVSITIVDHDWQAMISADSRGALDSALREIRSRFIEYCPEPMSEPEFDMMQRWTVIVRPTVETF